MELVEADTVAHGDMCSTVAPTFRIPKRNWELKCKRCVDVVVAAAMLLFFIPLLLVLAVVIRLDSRGPAIYRSRRVGRNGTRFWCYKLRTMVAGSDLLRAQLEERNERDGMLFKMAHDPRITRVGRPLRKYSLDELPQLWNVIRGDMSLVGPRPALPQEVARYMPEHFERLLVMPGITGAWQVHARCDPSFQTYVQLDTEYVRKWNFWLDITIMLKTVRVVLSGTGQ